MLYRLKYGVVDSIIYLSRPKLGHCKLQTNGTHIFHFLLSTFLDSSQKSFY